MKELIDEIENRTENYVLAYTRSQEVGNVVNTFWSGSHWVNETGIASILLNDVLNDFSNNTDIDDIKDEL